MNTNANLAELRGLPTPKPVPNEETYLLEREKALAFSEERRANYEKYLDAKKNHGPVDYLPVKLDIENVSRCNFRCSMCQVSMWEKGTRAADMTFDDFKDMIDEQYGLVEIKLQGMGEPMLGGKDFYEMIKYARSKHIWVRTVTNASLLHKSENFKKIIDSGVNELQISVDGATAESFEAIRNGSKFERVVTNCTMINEYCDSIDVIRTKMWTVVQRKNRHELDHLVRLASQMKFKKMVFSLNMTDWGQEDWRERNDAVTVEDSITMDESYALIELGKELGVEVTFWNVTTKYNSSSREKMCQWPFERAYISSDMRVVPCCMIANPEASDLGDAREFKDVWMSDVYEDFREAHIKGEIPKICRSCYE